MNLTVPEAGFPTKWRVAIYTAVAGALAVLVVLGIMTKEIQDIVLAAVGAVLDLVTAVSLIVAAKHITADSWSKLRLALYLAASAVFAALGVYGLVQPGVIATWLSTFDAVLNVIGIVLLGMAATKAPQLPEVVYVPVHAETVEPPVEPSGPVG